jgi:hypothetical protein
MSVSVRDLSVSLLGAERPETVFKILDCGKGDGFQARLSRFFSGHTQSEEAQTALNARKVISEKFGGDAIKFQSFMGRLTGNPLSSSSIGLLDFNALVESGAAQKLADLEKAHPTAFAAALSGSYADMGALNQALDKITKLANAEAELGKGRVSHRTIPAGEAGTPNDLACSVTKRGGMSCDWDKAKTQGSPLEQEATHLLKSGAELLEAAGKALQTPANEAPKPK